MGRRGAFSGSEIFDALHDRFGDHPNIGDIRGRGLFAGLEIVADRESRRPMPVEAKVHAAIKKEAMEQGLMCYPMGGTIDGERGNHVLLAPPYIIDETQVTEIVDKLDRTFARVL